MRCNMCSGRKNRNKIAENNRVCNGSCVDVKLTHLRKNSQAQKLKYSQQVFVILCSFFFFFFFLICITRNIKSEFGFNIPICSHSPRVRTHKPSEYVKCNKKGNKTINGNAAHIIENVWMFCSGSNKIIINNHVNTQNNGSEEQHNKTNNKFITEKNHLSNTIFHSFVQSFVHSFTARGGCFTP